MNADRAFFDANLLVYAHDRSEGAKHRKASGIVASAWQEEKLPSLSLQVLQETHVTLVRKGLEPGKSAEVVRHYLEWNVVENRVSLFREALELQQSLKLSFWDANILAAAIASGAEELWSEDFQEGRDYGGVRVVNPFKALESSE